MQKLTHSKVGWRWWAAGALFMCGFLGLVAGVPLSERPDVLTSGWLTKAYYALGFFVVGGLDLGTPIGGAWWAQTLLWIAFFGAPLLTASAVIEAVVRVLAPGRWQLRRIKGHTIVFGSGRIAMSYLTVLIRASPKTKIVVVDAEFDPVKEQELKQKFNATVVVGDLTHEFLLQQLRLNKARRVLLLGANDFQGFEAASRILDIAPRLRGKIILRCLNLRFMRSLHNTRLTEQCEVFNTYHMAASGFVHDNLISHFRDTQAKDVVVVAGFGRFGQSVLEELHAHAATEIAEVAVVDKDAARRVLVVDEQKRIEDKYQRTVFEGDISHPQVWQKLTAAINLSKDLPTIVLGTGHEQDNLRTALWIKQKYPNALVFARTTEFSKFATEVGTEHGVKSFSITKLFEDNVPEHWVSS